MSEEIKVGDVVEIYDWSSYWDGKAVVEYVPALIYAEHYYKLTGLEGESEGVTGRFSKEYIRPLTETVVEPTLLEKLNDKIFEANMKANNTKWEADRAREEYERLLLVRNTLESLGLTT